jgi:Flp pilus assembly protein TadB
MDTAMDVESKTQADASIGQLVSQLSAQTSRLVRDEMRLAQQEFRESAKHAGIGAGLLSAAGLLALLGLATVVAAAVAALSLVLPVWAAALIIGAVLFAAAGIAGLISKKQVEQTTPVPQRTVDNVKQDIDEVKEARHERP